MDNSTLGLLAVFVILFVFVRYFTSSSNKSASATSRVEDQTRKEKAPRTSTSTATTGGAETTGASVNQNDAKTSTTTHRPVTKDMVEIVQQFGPTLSEEQIVFDLSKTGSIEVTVNNILANGGKLPDAPQTKSAKEKKKSNWANTEAERNEQLAAKKQEMIMKARIRLRQQLSNEINL